MRNGYFNRLRAAAAKKDKVIITKRAFEFTYNGKPYRYEYRITPNSGLAYLYNGRGEEIYNPYKSTEEGRNIYEAFTKQIQK